MKTHFVRIAALFAALFASSLFALPLKQAKLTVSGYQGGETALENFPLLVRISPERIPGFSYDDCALGGSDISFALENGEILPYEIDTWVNDGESLASYAHRRLKELQAVSKEISYSRSYNPDVLITDRIRLHYPAQDLSGIFVVVSQSVTLDACATTTEVRRLSTSSALWQQPARTTPSRW